MKIARHYCVRALLAVARLIAALALSVALFAILPLMHRYGRQAAGLQAVTARQPQIELRPQEQKRQQPQQARPIRRSAEARSSGGGRDRGLDFRFSPDLSVGGDGMGVAAQDVEIMVFEEGQTDEPAIPLSRPMPPYPPRARQEGIEGTVVIEFVVDREGRVRDITFVSLPSPVFRSVVASTVRTWRFRPARHNGVPVSMRFRIPIEFRQEG